MDANSEVLSLFPRYLLKQRLNEGLLADLQQLARAVLSDPGSTPDASGKLAGQLALQRELGPQFPPIAQLCAEVIVPACEQWIRHVIDQQPPQGRGPWVPGGYRLQMIDVWLNLQRAGDYNPIHTHGGSFSGVIFLQVPPQITGERFDGQLCFHGPEEWHIQSFRTGMAHYVLPVPGDLYVFPAWQPHSVAPFRGEGERWSLAFNVVAVPQPRQSSAPQQPFQTQANVAGNVSLSSHRPRPGGFS
ncbi:putative 2OG-Fe(II) oxygenase [Cyanobium sp. ATX 6F1]|uniref:putative 2OG-Fe(II) oxygenase n=1 Tax=Cyanobium sp. ATX 6F1 TaxID=2823702 RepID=UPI0020CE7946|nr:putative 2OG-Fe(II) oxygenase [Cyanobium sp. ATX 6F1]MCP9917169.1 2OG-Fe(II) oxygenase family protein [Cyanobium sp. ATX 6F1]